MIVPKKLPGRPSVCRACRQEIRWGVTVAGPNGPGGRSMPLDVYPNDEGNAAVRVGVAGRLFVRVLGKDDRHDRSTEILAMPHFATCEKAQADDLVAGLESMLAEKATAGGDGA